MLLTSASLSLLSNHRDSLKEKYRSCRKAIRLLQLLFLANKANRTDRPNKANKADRANKANEANEANEANNPQKSSIMKIFAIGMNYAEYNKSQNETLSTKEGPVIFTKADSALLKDKKPFFIPDDLGTIEYETELVVRICRLGKTISERFAHRYYDAVTVGIDFTARELQQKLRAQGLPWDLCKGFDGSAALGEWVKKEKFLDIQRLRFHLDINGQTVQEGCTSDMLYKVDEIISYISRYFTLKTGDILYTGCPSGCGPVHINDHLEGYIEERKVLDFNCK